MQFDEKWAFVAKKEKHCDRANPDDDHKGDAWDHVAFDPENRLVVSAVPGARTVENTEALVTDFHRRTSGRTMNLMTSDEYPAYRGAILRSYGRTVTPPRTGMPGRPRQGRLAPRRGLRYAVVEKTRKKGRVVQVACRVVFGSERSVREALSRSSASRSINTAFIERQNGTDRHRNARKVRKTYRFSKDWRHHEAATYFSLFSYNFCWPVRTLRVREDSGAWTPRTPAMAAGLADHVWSIEDWIKYPIMQ